MIKLTRVDERFVHGQVAFAWTNTLGADCIFIVSDIVVEDKLRTTTLKLAAPAGVKFVVKSVKDAIELLNGEKTNKYKIFLIVDSTKDARELVENVASIRQINLGNMKMKEGKNFITNSIAVDKEDIENIKKMVELGAEVECRAVPTDKKVMALDAINRRDNI
ncbi:MAG: PTS sugar transporter subunit IIB [Lachnospiraceae bacterium]|nr:PTS sugar transporter subunit IIB [Lachnospiraceae bacterium]